MRFIRGVFYLFLNYIRYFPSQFFRELIYSACGMKIGRGATIYGGVEVRSPGKITIGERSIVGHNCLLDGRKGLDIGADVNISSGAWIWTLQHDINDSDFCVSGSKVIIEDNAWLCSRVTILPGVRIGKCAVVAAGAVVTKNVADYDIVGGIPAKKIGVRDLKSCYRLKKGLPLI